MEIYASGIVKKKSGVVSLPISFYNKPIILGFFSGINSIGIPYFPDFGNQTLKAWQTQFISAIKQLFRRAGIISPCNTK